MHCTSVNGIVERIVDSGQWTVDRIGPLWKPGPGLTDPITGNQSQFYPPLHCTALHCTALHCTALHCFSREASAGHKATSES
jgi:hypothetical protein